MALSIGHFMARLIPSVICQKGNNYCHQMAIMCGHDYGHVWPLIIASMAMCDCHYGQLVLLAFIIAILAIYHCHLWALALASFYGQNYSLILCQKGHNYCHQWPLCMAMIMAICGH